jgi:hypothetical protein
MAPVKKLLALLVMCGLFSLGCTDTATKSTEKKPSTSTTKPGMSGAMKDEGVKPKDETKPKDEAAPKPPDGAKPEPKKDNGAKPEKKDAGSK